VSSGENFFYFLSEERHEWGFNQIYTAPKAKYVYKILVGTVPLPVKIGGDMSTPVLKEVTPMGLYLKL